MAMMGNEKLKYQFIILRGTKQDAKVLQDAIEKHIAKLAEDVEKYSKIKNDQNRLQNAVDGIKTLMSMRDHFQYIGTDEIYDPHDFPSPIKYIL